MKRVRLTDQPKRIRIAQDSIDLVARRVIMCSFAYYGGNISIVTDEEYDRWCLRLAKEWNSLSPFRQWQLGSAEDIKTTGYHVKVTWLSVDAAVHWMHEKGISFTYFGYKCQWHFSKKHQVRWLKVTDFAHFDHNPHEIVAKSRKSPKKQPISTQKPTKKRVKLSETYSSVSKKRAKKFFN